MESNIIQEIENTSIINISKVLYSGKVVVTEIGRAHV